jgi:S-adenosylmethionine-diacylgycerolhomoserine-N-methlytransferase
MSLAADLKMLFHLTLAPVRGSTHAERMNSFYGDQAQGYDDFRRRLLPGRETLCRSLDLPNGGVWLDLGGGTGQNLESRADRIPALKRVYVVDLAAKLLDVARRRALEHGWTNVETVEADATTFTPLEPVDVVTFSYSLTMIPDWPAVLEQAERVLKPGGTIGIVDFYVSRKYADPPRTRHSWFTRTFWPTWFAMDNVFLSGDHLPTLVRRFKPIRCDEGRAKVPYLPFVRVPYYLFVGRKRTTG